MSHGTKLGFAKGGVQFLDSTLSLHISDPNVDPVQSERIPRYTMCFYGTLDIFCDFEIGLATISYLIATSRIQISNASAVEF